MIKKTREFNLPPSPEDFKKLKNLARAHGEMEMSLDLTAERYWISYRLDLSKAELRGETLTLDEFVKRELDNKPREIGPEPRK